VVCPSSPSLASAPFLAPLLRAAAADEAVRGRDEDARPPVSVPAALIPAVVARNDEDDDDDEDGDDEASRISAASEAGETP
jgi:hypothetical protein